MADNNNNDPAQPGKVFSQSDLGFEYGAHENSESFDIKSIAPALLDDLSEFIFITDAYSQKIVYINKPLAGYLKIDRKFCATCYSLFRGREIPCRTCKARQGACEGVTLVHNSLKTSNGDALQVTCRHFKANGRPYNMMICTRAAASEEISRAMRSNPDESDAIASLIEILTTRSDSPDMQIAGYLRFFCTFFRGERGFYYIPQHDPDFRGDKDQENFRCTSYFSRVDRKDITELSDKCGDFLRLCFTLDEAQTVGATTLSEDHLLSKWMVDHGIDHALVIPFSSGKRTRGVAIVTNPDLEVMDSHKRVLAIAEGAVNAAALSLLRSYRIESNADIDPLTKLRTRSAMLKDINDLFPLKDLGVMALNINGLKVINETYGFKEGDSIIVHVASLLKQLLPSTNIIYRTSGDEFIAVYPGVSERDFKSLADMLKAFMSNERGFSAAVGGCWVRDGFQLQHAINEAGNSMMKAKQLHYHTVPADSRYRFTKDLVLDIISPVKISKLISNNNFMVYYQPKVRASGGPAEITSAEALIRLKFNGAIISPNEFIPPLEASHYTHLIDFFVLKTICRRMRERMDKGLKVVPVSCNFSRHSAVRPDFVESVKQLVDRYGIDSSMIIIEISERSQTFFKNELIAACNNLSKAGFKISIDDFGVAHANLWVLSDLPVNEVKFDKRLIDSLLNTQNEKIRVILKIMTKMCRILKIQTVAEGVEEEMQKDALNDIGVDEIQGYYYSKPIPQDDFYNLLDSGKLPCGA
ncbi:MAG: bifunctional diguanylate cyclase/phosphodiesterase [Aeromonadales bacterium]|nr:bifunctional diguanylate cyclase/phosphodiesterase [Aeromonadales bacterium]MDY2890892.1 bifunctional diguanylate cyclase/phosphodiesterase [Succinivibrio sp.]